MSCLFVVLLLLVPSVSAQEAEEVLCPCHTTGDQEHNADSLELLQHRFDHQIEAADDLIDRLNRYAEQKEAVEVEDEAPLILIDDTFVGPPFPFLIESDTGLDEKAEDDDEDES